MGLAKGKTRIAPTPSGYIHFGNALNFKLIEKLAKEEDLTLSLRIDDIDKTRFRQEYLDDIFQSLKFLNISYSEGPTDSDSFKNKYSQHLSLDKYFSVISKLQKDDQTYFCQCSRNDIEKRSGASVYDGHCRNLKYTRGVVRFNLSNLKFDAKCVNILKGEMGDFVLLGKDGLPSYQVVSVVEDDEKGMTHIVRGRDLFYSTLAQKILAQALNFTSFLKINFLFHELALDLNGQKLSKSEGALALKNLYLEKNGIDKFNAWFLNQTKPDEVTLKSLDALMRNGSDQ